MKFKSFYTQQQNAKEAAIDLHHALVECNPGLIFVFATSKTDIALLNKELAQKFEDSIIIGCTSAGEITTGKMLDNSVVAMAINKSEIEACKVEIVENLDNYAQSLDKAFESFTEYFGTPISNLDYKKYIGFILIDGLSLKEEQLMDSIGDQTNVFFIGGSSGDDLSFKTTYVFADGKVMNNAAVLCLLKPKTQFEILKTQSFVSTGKILKVTKANESKRQILEFNNKPATKAYAELLGVDEAKISDYFFSNPVGLMSGNEPYVRSPQRVDGETMYFYCSMKEGMELQLLQTGDIVSDTHKDLSNKMNEMGTVSAIINFHCILRTLQLKQSGQSQDYGKLFTVPTVGFSTYGECYLGHINQTSTMVLFK